MTPFKRTGRDVIITLLKPMESRLGPLHLGQVNYIEYLTYTDVTVSEHGSFYSVYVEDRGCTDMIPLCNILKVEIFPHRRKK